MSAETSCHFGHFICYNFKKKSLWSLILFNLFHDFIHVYIPGAGADNPLGRNFDANRNILSRRSFVTSFKKISLKSNFIHFFHDFICMDGWVRVLCPFNSISVISRRWKGEHERLCAMKCCLGLGRISPPAGFEPATPWSEVGSSNRLATQTLWFYKCI